MSPEPVTAERVYRRLKADVTGGRHRPRARLVERALADEYGVSISPIRDSAERLVGERLLEAQPGGGFMIPDVTEQGLRDLYFWHGQLVRNALHPGPAGNRPDQEGKLPEPDLSSRETIAQSTARLFAFLSTWSSNTEHVRAVVAAGERIHAVRMIESDTLSGVREELEAVQALTHGGSRSELIEAIWAYHRRRVRRVMDLVSAVGGTLSSRWTR